MIDIMESTNHEPYLDVEDFMVACRTLPPYACIGAIASDGLHTAFNGPPAMGMFLMLVGAEQMFRACDSDAITDGDGESLWTQFEEMFDALAPVLEVAGYGLVEQFLEILGLEEEENLN